MAIMRTIDAEAVLETHTDDGNIEISPTEISYATSRYDSAAELTISGLSDADPEVLGSYPESSSENVPATMLCWASNNRQELDEDERPGSVIAGGELTQGSVDEEGVWSGTVVDCIRKLRQTTFSGEYVQEGITSIAEEILSDAGIPEAIREGDGPGGLGLTGSAQFVTRTPPSEPDRSDRDARITGGRTQLYATTIDFTETPSFEALTEVLAEANWWWWCEPDNTIVVDTELPTETYELPYVTETSAGKQTPPWQAVEVIGERQGTGTRPSGVQDGERVIGTGSPIRATSGDGEPVFTHTDRSIESIDKAQAVADHIFRELRAQQKSGSVTALGDEEIRPLDAIQMPDHMGGESYLVSALTHTISSDKGFITEFECGGLLDPGADGELSSEDPPLEGSDGSGNDQGTAATPDDG